MPSSSLKRCAKTSSPPSTGGPATVNVRRSSRAATSSYSARPPPGSVAGPTDTHGVPAESSETSSSTARSTARLSPDARHHQTPKGSRQLSS
jgi:hypothetical protein